MRYPALTLSRTRELIDSLRIADDALWDSVVVWVGSGRDIDLTPLAEAAERMRAEFADGRGAEGAMSAEDLEGRFAGDVHSTLRDVPVIVLDDPGFWRYLAMRHFWWFIAEREAGPVSRGNAITYVDGGAESIPFRMFLRAQAIRDGDDYSLAGALPRASDFWRSHVLRVKTGTVPALSRSLARLQVDKQMPSTEVRPFAKRLNRLWTNLVFEIWPEDDCDALIAELFEDDTSSPE